MTLYKLIKLIPNSWPEPDGAVVTDYHDNEHSLDWDFGKNKISIGVHMNGDVDWAALIDGVEVSGQALGPKQIPLEIMDIFKRLGY